MHVANAEREKVGAVLLGHVTFGIGQFAVARQTVGATQQSHVTRLKGVVVGERQFRAVDRIGRAAGSRHFERANVRDDFELNEGDVDDHDERDDDRFRCAIDDRLRRNAIGVHVERTEMNVLDGVRREVARESIGRHKADRLFERIVAKDAHFASIADFEFDFEIGGTEKDRATAIHRDRIVRRDASSRVRRRDEE